MPRQMHTEAADRIRRMSARVTAAVIAGFLPNRDERDIEARLATAPRRDRIAVTAAVLTGLFVAALLAASFGPLGLGLYFLAVILLVR